MKKTISSLSLDIVGLMTAVYNVNNIKKVRYTLQFITVVLMKTLKDTHESLSFVDTAFILASSELDNPMLA